MGSDGRRAVKFFQGCRPQVYFHGAKLRRDKKTGRRLWGLTMIVTLNPELVLKCDEVIEQAYVYILTLDNQADEVVLGAIAQWISIDFFGLADDLKAGLHVAGVDLGGQRMTRDGQVVEFWFQFEIENNPKLHAFVKEYAFTRLWAEFKPRAEEIEAAQASAKDNGPVYAGTDPAEAAEFLSGDPGFLKAADQFTSCVRTGGIDSVTISSPGMEPVVIDKAAAENIHRRATKKK
jgi:hypothetical protein